MRATEEYDEKCKVEGCDGILEGPSIYDGESDDILECDRCHEQYCSIHDEALNVDKRGNRFCDYCDSIDTEYPYDDGDPGDVMLEDHEPHLWAI